jgi:hypothetical protein
MTYEQLQELFHRMDLRLARLDTKLEGLEEGQADIRSDIRVIQNRLDEKASQTVVSLWGATLAMLTGAAFALTAWL